VALDPVSSAPARSPPRRAASASRAPSYQALNELRMGALATILEEYATKVFPVHIVYVRQGLLPLKVRAFLDWMTPRLCKALADLDALDVSPVTETSHAGG
jgi:hypothetical protein